MDAKPAVLCWFTKKVLPDHHTQLQPVIRQIENESYDQTPNRKEKAGSYLFCRLGLAQVLHAEHGVYTGPIVRLGGLKSAKPRVNDFTGDFNISHDKELLMGVWTKASIKLGADIACLTLPPGKDEHRFLKTMMNTMEKEEVIFLRSTIKSIAEHFLGETVTLLPTFILQWALKEAFLKCIGIGLSLPLELVKLHGSSHLTICENAVAESPDFPMAKPFHKLDLVVEINDLVGRFFDAVRNGYQAHVFYVALVGGFWAVVCASQEISLQVCGDVDLLDAARKYERLSNPDRVKSPSYALR